jgi:NADPH-dependent ferric siderophore reductase
VAATLDDRIRTFLAEVLRVEDVHPHLRRITVGGADLREFEPIGPDTFLYVLLPPPGQSELTIDQTFTWEACFQMPENVRPVGAYYTVRAWRPGQAEVDLLFVLHPTDPDHPGGHASRWAARAEVGDPVALWGPRTAWAPPVATDGYLLVADDTGLPAAAAILEVLPPDVPVVLFAEVDGADAHQPLPERGSATDVRWIHRSPAAPGTTSLLSDAVVAHVRGQGLPGAVPYVWGGGESRSMTAVRKVVRHELGLAREQVSLIAYWRHADHAGDPVDEEG